MLGACTHLLLRLILSSAYAGFFLVACTSTPGASPAPAQSTPPAPTALPTPARFCSPVSTTTTQLPPPTASITVTELTVNGVDAGPGNIVTTFSRRTHTLAGRVVEPVPAGLELWAVTNPPDNNNTFLQGRIKTADDGRWKFDFTVGAIDEQFYSAPARLTVIVVTKAVGDYLASCGGTVESKPIVPAIPALPGSEVTHVEILKKER